jgi:hypothetical protein
MVTDYLRLPGVYKEGDVPAGLMQAATKISTHGAGADYQDSHDLSS